MDKIKAVLSDIDFINRIREIEEKEKDRKFCKHGLSHLIDVARIAYIMVLSDGNTKAGKDAQKEIIYATALLHDLGRYSEYEKNGMSHHEAGAFVAVPILNRSGFNQEEIEIIISAIKKHKKCSIEEDWLGYYIYKADKQSRNCFMCDAIDECYWPEDEKNNSILV